MKFLVCLLLTSVISTFSNAAFSNDSFYDLKGSQLEIVSHIGTPISGATILIGFAKNDPFDGNIFTTNTSGIVQIPALWKTPLPITIQAEGFLTTTYSDAMPMGRTLVMYPEDAKQAYELKGQVNGFGDLRRDGKVDVGFVMPSMSRRELLGFDLSSVISPESDIIKIINRDVAIPSNISLPRQRETYIFPITLDKPNYRIYSKRMGEQQFIASHAQFPLKRVVDKIRNGDSILDVINDITFIGGGDSTVEIGPTPVQRDMSVDTFKYTEKMTIEAPQIPAGKVVFSVAIVEKNQRLFPTDLKYVDSNRPIELSTLSSNETKYVASMLGNEPEESPGVKLSKIDFLNAPQFSPPLTLLGLGKGTSPLPPLIPKVTGPNLSQMSIALQQYSANLQAPEFLSHVDAPVLTDGEITLDPPEASNTIIPLGTVVVFSEIETIQQGELQSEKRTRLWEIYAQDWAEKVSIPIIDVISTGSISHRWEVIYLGKKVGSSNEEGLEAVTHISRNSIDIN